MLTFCFLDSLRIWRPCLDCRRCLKWYGHDLLNCPSRDPPCLSVLPEDQEPNFLVISLFTNFWRCCGQDPSWTGLLSSSGPGLEHPG
ncbi:hypothetical protein TNIN_236001 [Trichonephila inaurata madagascariensis]|uniref:Uncharacterized protein n=1 Tax=Trichonephila inaurata madagascariensis TaxID=2747483 RepID=A0A8X6Y076_9ARAC|nr:hypothetical protein TNIN_236001 [Trichonephila inaurata madagascariensis]